MKASALATPFHDPRSVVHQTYLSEGQAPRPCLAILELMEVVQKPPQGYHSCALQTETSYMLLCSYIYIFVTPFNVVKLSILFFNIEKIYLCLLLLIDY